MSNPELKSERPEKIRTSLLNYLPEFDAAEAKCREGYGSTHEHQGVIVLLTLSIRSLVISVGIRGMARDKEDLNSAIKKLGEPPPSVFQNTDLFVLRRSTQ